MHGRRLLRGRVSLGLLVVATPVSAAASTSNDVRDLIAIWACAVARNVGLAAQRALGCHTLMVRSGGFDTTVFTDFLRWGRADVLWMPDAAAVATGVDLSLVERATQQEYAAAHIVRHYKSIEEKDDGGCILDSSYPH